MTFERIRNINGISVVEVDYPDTVKYLPNAQFKRWFLPVANRMALALIMVPVVLIFLHYAGLLDSFMHLIISYLRLFSSFLLARDTSVLSPWIAIASHYAPVVFFVMCLPVGYLSIKMSMSPDIIALGPKGLYVGKTNSRMQTHVNIQTEKFIAWKDITDIKVMRPSGTKSNLDYCLEIKSSQQKPLTIRFGDLIVASQRQYFIDTIKKECSQWVDDEALLALEPPREKQSYTELWLSELSAPPKRDRLTPLEIGSELFHGQYKILQKLGVGGQGTVYLAESRPGEFERGEEIVLKEFVLPIYPDTQVRKAAAIRFQDEASLLTKLDHPQIVKLKNLFLQDHRAYLVLEHITGRNLKDIIAAEGPLPAHEIMRLAQQMTEILVFLHSQQPPVVHRDFTPDNLIYDGQIKLIDFSVAQSLTPNVTGSVVGKPHYIAPEQFRGKPNTQSDIYSMGATLFYLATGKEPEPITNLRLKDYKSDADDKLSFIIEKSTKLDLQARYQTATEVLKQLSQ